MEGNPGRRLSATRPRICRGSPVMCGLCQRGNQEHNRSKIILGKRLREPALRLACTFAHNDRDGEGSTGRNDTGARSERNVLRSTARKTSVQNPGRNSAALVGCSRAPHRPEKPTRASRTAEITVDAIVLHQFSMVSMASLYALNISMARVPPYGFTAVLKLIANPVFVIPPLRPDAPTRPRAVRQQQRWLRVWQLEGCREPVNPAPMIATSTSSGTGVRR